MFGVLLFNGIWLTQYIQESYVFVVVLQVSLITLIFLSSRFAHQAVLFLLLPYTIAIGEFNLVISYAFALVLSFTVLYKYLSSSLIGHFYHCAFYFKHGLDMWYINDQWRQFYNRTYKLPVFDLKFFIRKCVGIFVKEPSLFLLAAFLVYEKSYNISEGLEAYFIGYVLAFYFLLSFFLRLDKSIGDGYRYIEYLYAPLSIAVVSASFPYDGFKMSFIVLAVFTSLIMLYRVARQLARNLQNSGRIWGDEASLQVKEFLEGLPPSKVASLPMSISNYFSLESKHKYFYDYTFQGFNFLHKRGMTPYFKLDQENLLARSYIGYLVLDKKQVPHEVKEKVLDYYNYDLVFDNDLYGVYKRY